MKEKKVEHVVEHVKEKKEEDIRFSSASFEVITFKNDIFSDEENVSQALAEGSNLPNSTEEKCLNLVKNHLQYKDVIDLENAPDEKSLDENVALISTSIDCTIEEKNEIFSSDTIKSIAKTVSKKKKSLLTHLTKVLMPARHLLIQVIVNLMKISLI